MEAEHALALPAMSFHAREDSENTGGKEPYRGPRNVSEAGNAKRGWKDQVVFL